MAKRRASRGEGPKTASGRCKFGKVKTGPRKGKCLKSKRPKKK